ncbi:MAG: hypothetical protein WAR38_13880, partial [Chitinophagaceae bacterium]
MKLNCKSPLNLLLTGLLLFQTPMLFSQQPPLPAKKVEPRKAIIPTKPIVKKDSVTYVATPTRVEVNTRIATADEIYINQGTFLLRSGSDYRYLTIKDVVPATGSVAFLW